MSKFNSGLNPYVLSPYERIVKINGPQCQEIIRWYYEARDVDELLEQEGQHVFSKLLTGPSFEDSHDMIFTLQEIKIMFQWKEYVVDTDLTRETSEVLTKALEGKK